VGGGFVSLGLFNYPFGFVAITGIMGLIGVSINDSIVVLAALREERPRSVEETARIVVEATRHVVSTTLTTVIGFLPLLLDGGGLWPPMVIAISGGVIGGTVLALIFVPAVYKMLTRPGR
jgi:multidrug efflux pump subunit AcrB